MKRAAILKSALVINALMWAAQPASALDCRNVELISAWGVGGGTDTFLRTLAEPLSQELGVPVKVINIEGAMGEVARQELMSRPADGCSLVSVDPDVLTTELEGQTEVSLITDLKPVFRGHVDIGIIHGKAGDFDSWDALIKWASENPAKLNAGGTGAAGLDRTAIEITLREAGVEEFNYVPYNKAAEMHADLLGGRLHAMYDELSSVGGMVEAGQITPLIVINDKRLDVLPDTPAAGELGYVVAPSNWRGLAVQAEVADEIVAELSAVLMKATEAPSYREYESKRLLDLKADGKLGADDFKKAVAEEYELKKQKLSN
jgi:tripartite-type tricarboxylate transporter receptor subunit TctC